MRLTPQEALQRVSSAEMQGMRLVASKNKKKVLQPEFVAEMRTDGMRSKYPDGKSMLYLYRQGDGGLILPAFDEVVPVLGEAEQADFSVQLPPHIQSWLSGYAEEMDLWENRLIVYDDEGNEIVAAADGDAEQGAEAKQDIAAMIKTTWAQTAPYNCKLPVIDGKTCLVGCPAVTLGQLMLYWAKRGYRRGCTATPQYRYGTDGVIVKALSPVTVFDYGNMTTGKPTTAVQKEAVGTLLEYCGKALLMRYGVASSGVSPSTYLPLVQSRLRMGKAKTIYADKMGEAAFADAIYAELAKGNPVAMGGYHANGGHSFICDGYRVKDNKFHINWGWGKLYDGYYAMTALNPTSVNTYNLDKAAYIFRPEYILGDANRDGKVNITDVMTAVDDVLAGKYDEAADVNSDGKVTVADSQRIVDHVLGRNGL